MNLKECYLQMGGNYDDALQRLQRERTVQKFVLKFLNDPSYALFESSMARQDDEEALRAVHTLKGICQNFSFTRLYESSAQVTLALKEGNRARAIELSPRLAEDYAQTVRAIEALRDSLEAAGTQSA